MIKEKIIAILPMRAGSIRVTNKNIRLINNKPLYEYIIEALLKSKCINKIVINTDIKKSIFNKYLKQKKINIIERKENLRDNCNINKVIADTLKKVRGEIFFQTHATNPLLRSVVIDDAILSFIKNFKKYDSYLSVNKLQKRLWSSNTKPINHKISDEPTTQNLEKIYEENSCFYIFTRNSFLKNNNRIGNNPKMFEISKFESLDIDEEIDLDIAKIMINLKKAGKSKKYFND